MAERDIELVLLTGAGASCAFGASGGRIAAMKDWANRLAGALGQRDIGASLLAGLEYKMDGPEFERRLGQFLAAARSFSDSKDLMLRSGNIPYTQELVGFTRPNIERWHDQVTFEIQQIIEVVHETLYSLFGDPSADIRRASSAYSGLLDELGLGRGAVNWVYATTNYDRVGDEALEDGGFRIAWGERARVRLNEPIIDPDNLLDGVKTSVPVLHLHGRIGWFRKSRDHGGEAASINTTNYQPGFGTPIVMLPDPNKVYDSDPVINSIWTQFERALDRAQRVLVLGHSLNDVQILEALQRRADPHSVAVTYYGNPSELDHPDSDASAIREICETHLPEARLIPIRFGEEDERPTKDLGDWRAGIEFSS